MLWFGKKAKFIRRLQHAADPAELHFILEEARANGWLEDGSLRGARLVDANLRRADLRRARLVDSDLTGADLREADLTGADLSGTVLEAADLTGAVVSDVQLVRASSLVSATMPDGSRYDGRYMLAGDLGEAHQDGVYPDQPERLAEWYGIALDAYEAGQDWANLHLGDLRIKAAYQLAGPPSDWAARMREAGSLTDGSLHGEDLMGLNLAHSQLVGASLRNTVLAGVHADDADLSDADLSGANLAGASLQGASLTRAVLRGADLSGADLTSTNLEGADLEAARLDGAIFVRANLTGTNFTEAQIIYAEALAGSTMPDETLYDGRYELPGDIEAALDDGIDLDAPEEMAHWYNIDLESYEAGQLWANMNLPRLRPENE